VGSLYGPQYTFADEETQSHFTSYSLSSSVMRRNEQLTLLDDRFEQVMNLCALGCGHVRLVSCESIISLCLNYTFVLRMTVMTVI